MSINLKTFRSQVKERKHSTGKKFQNLDKFIAVRGRKLLTYLDILMTTSRSGNIDRKIMQPIRM